MKNNFPSTIIVVDIDNNLADNEHRKYLLPNKDTPSSQKDSQLIEFHNACDKDVPNKPLIDALKEYYLLSSVKFLFISGRKDLPEVRSKTVTWLENEGFHTPEVLLRHPNSRSNTKYFKRLSIEKYLESNFDNQNVNLILVEDNEDVIRAFQNSVTHVNFKGIHVTPKEDNSVKAINAIHNTLESILSSTNIENKPKKPIKP